MSGLSTKLRQILHATAASLVLATVVLAPRPAGAVDDPSLDYKTLKTPNFYVHYPEKLEGVARRSARIGEEAHAMMTPMLGQDPPNRVHIVVNDNVDAANGSATVFGRRTINIFAMPPAPEGVLGYYTDWLRVLIYHEYAHILHLDTETGLIQAANELVGGILHPNALLPSWYIEGLAVEYESRLTGSGRNLSSLYQMWLRTEALQGELFDLGTLSGTPIAWPQGSAPYLYGGSFMDYVTDRHGIDFATKFNHEYGGRLAPYSLNQTAENASGETFHEMWKGWEAHQKGKAFGTHVVATARGRTPLQQITDGGGVRRHPHVRPGTDTVTYYESGLNSHSNFSSTPVADRSTRELIEVSGAVGSSDWTPDGETLVYGRGTYKNSVYIYQDLYAWHAPTGRTYQLTEQARARDPAISPDGDRIAYTKIQPGTADLVVCDLTPRVVDDCETVVGGTLHPADEDRHWQQIASPTWTPDGDALVISWWRLDERQRDLWRIELGGDDGPKLRRLTNDAAQDTAPEFGPRGILYWSADRTGVFNIYARRPGDGRVWQVSSVDTGLFQPAVSPEERWIYAVGYTAEGYELMRFPRPSRFLRPAPDSYEPHGHPDYPEIDTSSWEESEYVAPRWLRPLIVKPNLGAFTSGGGAGATVLGRAPVGHHRWWLSAAVLSAPEFNSTRGNLGLRYRWTGGPFDLNASVAMREAPRRQSLFAENRYIPFIQREYQGNLSLSFPIRFIDKGLSLSTSLDVRWATFRREPETIARPGDLEPRGPNHGWYNSLSTSISYSNLDRYAQSVSIERGISGFVSLRVQDELFGSDYDAMFLNYGLSGYYPNPWVDRHVMKLSLRGGIGRSELGGPVYGLGGYRPQDVLTSVIFQSPRYQFVLRGYPPGSLVGSQFQLWKFGYRFPILRLDQGFSTVPVFLKRIKGEVFADAGGAFYGVLANADLRSSVGAQVQLGTQFGYYLSGALRAGVARGLGEGGVTEFFLQYGGGF